MTDHVSESQNLISAEKPCPMCGSSDFTWGVPQIKHGEDSPLRLFFAYGEEIGHKYGGEGLEARRCNQCGNVLFFANGQ